MAAQVDLSLDTLRYDERAGLMPRVQRLPNGHRRLSKSDRVNVVAHIAELQHNLEQLDGEMASDADAFGVAAREPTP
jgi:DNA-binding transcriptional MerR regulator